MRKQSAGGAALQLMSALSRRSLLTGTAMAVGAAALPRAVGARMLDRAAADRMRVEAFHFPFPACGHIARTRGGYELVPVEWAPL